MSSTRIQRRVVLFAFYIRFWTCYVLAVFNHLRNTVLLITAFYVTGRSSILHTYARHLNFMYRFKYQFFKFSKFHLVPTLVIFTVLWQPFVIVSDFCVQTVHPIHLIGRAILMFSKNEKTIFSPLPRVFIVRALSVIKTPAHGDTYGFFNFFLLFNTFGITHERIDSILFWTHVNGFSLEQQKIVYGMYRMVQNHYSTFLGLHGKLLLSDNALLMHSDRTGVRGKRENETRVYAVWIWIRTEIRRPDSYRMDIRRVLALHTRSQIVIVDKTNAIFMQLTIWM